MRIRRIQQGNESLQYGYAMNLADMGGNRLEISGDRPQLWDLWTEKDKERGRYALGNDNWDRVLVCLCTIEFDIVG
jgi:hypothetical protein